mmetsp:Transcript_47386/g.151075  ORF Transcript_47386/g.151075 Transcript_47386/m.151075 type:complete len:348 (+) Transcript_47386:3-1046(+)
MIPTIWLIGGFGTRTQSMHCPTGRAAPACASQHMPRSSSREARLLGRGDEPLEHAALDVHRAGALGDGVDGQHDVALVHLADGDTGVTGHGGVHGLLCQRRTIKAVVGVGRNGADHISRIDVLDGAGNAQRLAVCKNLILDVRANICEHLVAASVGGPVGFQDGVAATLGNDEDPLLLGAHDLGHIVEELVLGDIHLGDEADIHHPRRERGGGGDEAAAAAHELHQADAIRVGRGLHIRGLDGLGCLRRGRIEAEARIEQADVVVDCLGNADDRTLVLNLLHGVEGLHRPLVGSIAAEDEVLPNIFAGEGFGDLDVGGVAAVAHEDGSALCVDVLNALAGELDPRVR